MTSNRDKWDEWVVPQGSYNKPPQQGGSGWGNPYDPGQSQSSPYDQPPQSPPPPPQFQRPEGADGDGNDGGSNLGYIVVALLVTVAVAGAAIWYLTGVLRGDDSKEQSAQAEVTVTETAPSGGGADPADSGSSESESSSTTSKRKEHKPSPQGRSCGSVGAVDVYAVTDVTSCPFAMSVAKEVGNLPEPDDGDSFSVDAFSSVTNKTYNMKCSAKGEPVTEVTCQGGNNANVQVIVPLGDR